MAAWGRSTVLLVFPLWINFGSVGEYGSIKLEFETGLGCESKCGL